MDKGEHKDELPRERFMAQGADALTDAELLAVLLRSGVQGMPVLSLAEELLKRYDGSLVALSNATVQELCEIQGMGEAKSVGLAAAFAIGRRLLAARMAVESPMDNPQLLAEYMRLHLETSLQEEFHVLLLDNRLCLLKDLRVTTGLVDRSLVHAREVFREAIRESCSQLIIVHTHPSGNVEPSPEDRQVTRQLVEAGKIIGINILDHLVVAPCPKKGQKGYYSFREHGFFK